MNPCNELQQYVLREITERLEDETVGCHFVSLPTTKQGVINPDLRLVVGFSESLQGELPPDVLFGRIPKPRNNVMVLTITTLPNIPEGEDIFDLTRTNLAKKASHFGILVEGKPEKRKIERAIWSSMVGNFSVLEGDQNEILDNLSLRIQAYAGAEKVNNCEGDDVNGVLWREWTASGVHSDIPEAGLILGQAGIIEDKLDLVELASPKQARAILSYLNQGNLSEGMRSQLDPDLRIMAITATGGRKVQVSGDPLSGEIVGIGKLTKDGVLIALLKDCPSNFRGFSRPSVEAHQNGMIYLAGALVNAGHCHDLDSFWCAFQTHLSLSETVPILPKGLEHKATCIEHFHRQPKKGTVKNPERVEIVYPDRNRFPEVEFPCGTREEEWQILSALFNSECFSKPGPLDKVIIVVLSGHGSIAVSGGKREELLDVLVNGMEMEEPVRI